MLGFFSETELCGHQSFRSGNTSPATGVLEALKDMRCLCPKGTDIGRCRSDSAGWTVEMTEYCDDTRIEYTITAKMNAAVKKAISIIPESAWKPLIDSNGRNTGREFAETVYSFENGSRAHRLIVQRSANRQMDLFSEGKQGFYAISTNSSRPAPDLIFFHNARGQAENYNKELKYSLHLNYLPTNDFHANQLWFSLGVLVYNLFQRMKATCLPKSWATKKISTIRWQLIQIPGRLVYHARQWVLNVSAISQEIFAIFQSMRARLCQT